MSETHDSQTLGRRVNELLLLSALEREPMHGYQVALEIERRSAGYFRFNHGTLYPILHRLEQEGMIVGDWVEPDSGRSRKCYALTEAGRTYLAEIAGQWRRLARHLETFMPGEDGDEQVRTGAA
jgi:PadR family transcriptional regulator, regulatory protein PadR